MASARRSLARWIPVGAALAGAAVVALVLAGVPRTEDEGLVVFVRVLDAEGEPVRDAQVQNVFRPGWKHVDAEGEVRLTNVVLRVGEAPGNATLPTAIALRARFHAQRNTPATIRQRPDGTWEAEYRLAPHGLMRLAVTASGQQRRVQAYVEPGPDIEPTEGRAIAEPDRPVLYRVFGSPERVTVRVGGAAGTASERVDLEAPSLGFLVERTIDARPATPIFGQMLPGDDPQPPTWRGRVEVWQLEPDGSALQMPSAVIDGKGEFIVPYAAMRGYRLVARPGFRRPSEAIETSGGAEVEIVAGPPRPWAVLAFEPGASAEDASFEITALPSEDRVHIVDNSHVTNDATFLALPEAGRFRIQVRRRGTETAPLVGATVVVDAPEAGPVETAVRLEPLPQGTLDVRLAAEDTTGMRGASIRVVSPTHRAHREATLLPSLARTSRFENLEPGPYDVVASWRTGEMAVEWVRAVVAAETVTVVQIERVRGGRLRLRHGAPVTGRRLVVSCAPGASPYGDAPFRATCRWNEDEGVFEPEWALRPGAYEARIAWEDAGEDAHLDGPVPFVIEVGKTVVVDLSSQ